MAQQLPDPVRVVDDARGLEQRARHCVAKLSIGHAEIGTDPRIASQQAREQARDQILEMRDFVELRYFRALLPRIAQ